MTSTMTSTRTAIRTQQNTIGAALNRSARKHGGKLALAFNDRRWRYGELNLAVNRVANALLDAGPMWGYLIDGHGLYAWGRDMAEARRHLDAFDFLLGCELELRRLAAGH